MSYKNKLLLLSGLIFVINLFIMSYYNLIEFNYQDDTVFLGNIYFNKVFPSVTNKILYYFYGFFIILFDSISAAKVVLLLIVSLVFYFIGNLLHVFQINKYLAVTVSFLFLIMLIKFDALQLFFVSGSHPIVALFFYLVLIFLFFQKKNKLITYKSFLFSFLFVLLIPLISPIFILMPLVVCLLYLTDDVLKKNKKNYLIVNLLLLTFSFFNIYYHISHHHYQNKVGWASYNFDFLISNFINYLNFLVIDNIFYLLLIFFFALLSVRRAKLLPKDNIIKIIIISLLSFLFTAIPYLTQTIGHPRHYIASLLIFYLSFFFASLYLLECSFFVFFKRNYIHKLEILFKPLASFLLIAFFCFYLTSLMSMTEKYKKSYLAMSNLKNVLTTLKLGVDDQILIFIDKSLNFNTLGFNHWSTWFFRTMLNNVQIIGLVGYKSDFVKNDSPFVISYKDHDSEYWYINNERSARKKMIGLEKSRNSYCYFISEDLKINKINQNELNFCK